MQFDTLTVIALCLSLSFILSEMFFKFKYPRVLGQIIAGIILGIPIFKVFFNPQLLADIEFLSDLGIIFLLLLVGLEINLEKFKKTEKDTIIIAAFSTLLPFALGFILMKAMGYPNIVAFVVGAAFSLTAEGTKLKVLLDFRALNTKVGVIMLGAGILDDVFEVLFLSLLLVFTHQGYSEVVWLPFKILFFVGIVYVLYKIFPYVLRKVERERSRIALFSFVIIFALYVAVISKQLTLGPIIGAFIAGIIIHLSEHKKYEHREIIKELNAITFAFIIPFFFINIGLKFDWAIFANKIWLTLAIILVATISKVMAAIIATPFTDLTLRQTHLIGWGMNSRGAIELVIAGIAYTSGLIPAEIYSAIVLMALITTLMFPIIMKKIMVGNRQILNECRDDKCFPS